MLDAPAVSKAIAEGGSHFAQVTVFLDIGGEVKIRGPARRNRQEALKDCLELRKLAAKSTGDPSQFSLRQRVKELKETVWTVKDLGGRMLDGAEGPPLGFAAPRSSSPEAPKKPAESDRLGAEKRFKGIVKGKVVQSGECIVEVADVSKAVSGDKAEMALRRCFSQFGPVLEVRLDAGADESGRAVASVRFASAKAAETALAKARQGFLPLLQGDSHSLVRLRQLAATEAVWRKFPQPRAAAPELEGAPSKKKLRPNERFASRMPAEEAQDESEAFWEAQHGIRGKPAEPPPVAEPPPPAPEPEPAAPEKPAPEPIEADAGEDDREVFKCESEVAKDMCELLEKPFSQQRKALKKMRLHWHPDKNPDRMAIATRVFQFIQKHEEWLAHHDLA